MSLPAQSADFEVTPAVLAQVLKCSRFEAYRKLKAIETTHPTVVHRRGRNRAIYAMASDLRSHVRELRQGIAESPLEREVKALRTALAEQEKRMDANERANIEFRRIAHQWFERVRRLEVNAGR